MRAEEKVRNRQMFSKNKSTFLKLLPFSTGRVPWLHWELYSYHETVMLSFSSLSALVTFRDSRRGSNLDSTVCDEDPSERIFATL
mmetsp:Transcript_24954/g.34704  ORF Transcript_24954/g.34704 Transcript_24954/m.34704 type:complete len:85 (+) Transcript_24954:402-656(+)